MYEQNNEVLTFEPLDPFNCDQAKKYEYLADEFEKYVHERDPKLDELTHLLLLGYTRHEYYKEYSGPHSTVRSRIDKLKRMLEDFLANQP